MDRRAWLASLTSVLGGVLVLGWNEAESGPRARRRRRRRVRRRIRRRHRRLVVHRIVSGRRVWIVPVALAVGWELVHDDRVVVVTQTKVVEKEGAKIEVAIVSGSDGKLDEIEIVREDTGENRKELEGSQLPDDDTKTPGVHAEIDVEE